jgi:pullulanase
MKKSQVAVNEVSQTVTFTLDYQKATAKITGSLDYWSAAGSGTMDWVNESGRWVMKKTLEQVPPGLHQYQYLITPDGQKEFPMNALCQRNAPGSTFLMPGIRVFSSRKNAIRAKQISLAAWEYSNTAIPQFLETPVWSVQPPRPGITVSPEGVLFVDPAAAISEGELVTITASAGGKTGVKKLPFLEKDPIDKPFLVTFFRQDYDISPDWRVWSWGDQQKGEEYHFAEEVDLGRLAGFDHENFMLKKGDWREKTANLTTHGQSETYYIEEKPNLILQEYTSFKDAVRAAFPAPKITAYVESKKSVRICLSHTAPETGLQFELYENGNKLEGVAWDTPDNQRVFHCTLPHEHKLDPTADLEIRASGLYQSGKGRMRGVLEYFIYDGNDLGATYTRNKTKINLRVWAPTATSVSAMLNQHYPSTLPDEEIPMQKEADNGTWTASLDYPKYYGCYYSYQVIFHNDHSHPKSAVDPYAAAVSQNGTKAVLIDIQTDSRTIPANWDPDRKPCLKEFEDAIIYELHTRDFSVDEHSGIKPDWRAKYLAFTQKNTTLPTDGSIKTGLDHLAELGITHLHLLPVFDYGSVPEDCSGTIPALYDWGYDPWRYNVPEGTYSTAPCSPEVRIREFREMVQALHDRNIRVVMDMVYNHVFQEEIFDNIVPGGYFRTDDEGKYTNGSGCGNELATERAMVRKLIVDSTKFWAKNYGVDGFRFDLMGIMDTGTVLAIKDAVRRIDEKMLIYGEPWSGGPSSLKTDEDYPGDQIRQTLKGQQKWARFAVFNDDFRNSIRGRNGEKLDPAYINEPFRVKSDILTGVKGSIGSFTVDPEETINYVASHDNYTLWDQIVNGMGRGFEKPSEPRKPDADDIRRDKLAYGIILTSQGIPFIHAGDEMLRTKFGDYNSYQSPDEYNKIRWDWKKDYIDVFNYYKGLIALRKEHPAFRMTSREQIENHFQEIMLANDMVAYKLTDNANGDSWENILVVYNPYPSDQQIPLDEGAWSVVVNDQEAGPGPVTGLLKTFKGTATVPKLSMMVLTDTVM